jgi:uncharacterized membrane protein YgdD (TMEM256/DUF423 family)
MTLDSWRFWIFIAGISGIVAVGAGAYGYHSLPDDAKIRDAFNIAVQYHMFHTLALFAVAWLKKTGSDERSAYWVNRSGWFFLSGIIMFSGTLYSFCLTGVNPIPMGAPIGGGMFLVAWAMLAWSAIRTTKKKSGD